MRVKCLGGASYPIEAVITAIPRPKDWKKPEPFFSPYFTLGQKQYLPLSKSGGINKSKEFYAEYIRLSKKEPQQIFEISNEKIKESTRGRLYLYNEKIYEFDRNDYDQQTVKSLILAFLEKERGEFAELKRKYKA